MPTKIISYESRKELHLVGCEDVSLCLGNTWAARTINGSTIVKAKVLNSGRPLGRSSRSDTDYLNTRGDATYTYSFEVDSAAFAANTPIWLNSLTCADIREVIPYSCLTEAIWAAAATGTGAQGPQGAVGAQGPQGA